MKNISFVLIILIFASGVSAEVTKTGTTAGTFLNIDVGARAVGMGSAYCTLAEDVSALYWNPAGIARLNRAEALFTHTQWIADISFNYVGVAIPLGSTGVLGVSATFLSMDDMEVTTIDYPDGTGEVFSAGNTAFGLTFARNLTDRFSIGMSVKYAEEKIYNSKASAVAFDIGTIFNTKLAGLKIAMSISNYGSKMQIQGRDLITQKDINEQIYGNNPNINAMMSTDKFDLPLLFRFGLSMDALQKVEGNSLIIAIDATHPNDNVECLNIGLEYAFNDLVFLRAGHSNLGWHDKAVADSDDTEDVEREFGAAEGYEGGLSFGAGLKYELSGVEMSFDYAYRDFGRLSDIQMFTIGLAF